MKFAGRSAEPQCFFLPIDVLMGKNGRRWGRRLMEGSSPSAPRRGEESTLASGAKGHVCPLRGERLARRGKNGYDLKSERAEVLAHFGPGATPRCYDTSRFLPLQEWLFLRGPRYFIRSRMRATSTPASTCPMTESRKSAIGNTSSIGEDLSPHQQTTRRIYDVQPANSPVLPSISDLCQKHFFY